MSLKPTEQLDHFFDAVLSLKTREECYLYFEDICTMRELQSISQRQAVAEALEEGLSYQQTIAKTGASSATISRVKRCIDYGTGGYQLVRERRKGTDKDDSDSE